MALHDWLPSFQRTMSMRGVKDPAKQQCRVCKGGVESTYHILAQCSSSDAAQALLKWIQKLAPGSTLFDVIYLNVEVRHGTIEETAIYILTAMPVHTIWGSRDREGISAVNLRAEAFALMNSLMNTKFSAHAKIIHSILC